MNDTFNHLLLLQESASDANDGGIPANPDMQGYAVRLSSFVIHLGIAILLTRSDNPRSCYAKILLQILFILIGTLSSISRNQLNVADAQFTIVQTRSPVCVYILLFIIPRLFFHNSMYKQIGAQKTARKLDWRILFDRFLALLSILLVLILHLVLYFDPSAYMLGESSVILISADHKAQKYVLLAIGICLAVFYETLLHRGSAGWKVRRALMRTLTRSSNRSKGVGQRLTRHHYWGLFASWGTMLTVHPWMLFVLAAIMFWHWSIQMEIWTIEEGYQFTYGQFLAIAPAIEVFYQCLKLFWTTRKDLILFTRQFPSKFLCVVTGTDGEYQLDLQSLPTSPWDFVRPDVSPREEDLPTQAPVEMHPIEQGRQARSRRHDDRSEVDITDNPPYVRRSRRRRLVPG
ncbi:hypothetical protein VKT23_015630 [Stygiomarasmius scandens]|uniref:Pheromone receptor n=1 Tax=Marasmiellus scandens TaxID=2682957 RepID=A0ABR1IX33_9AGAR